MGQLHATASRFLLTNGEDVNPKDPNREFLALEPSQSLLPRGIQSVCGLTECKRFLSDNLAKPLSYNRQVRDTMVTHDEIAINKFLVLGGRASVGKRTLLYQTCIDHHLALKIISSAEDLDCFDWATFNQALQTETILAIESSVLSASFSGNDAKTIDRVNEIIDQMQKLSQRRFLTCIVFLIHNAQAYETLGLHKHMNIRMFTMYARVPPIQCRKDFIQYYIRNFQKHALLSKMTNFVDFTLSPNNYIDPIADASAWYTPGEQVAFLERCFNDVLVELLPYNAMASIPSSPPIIQFYDVVMDYLQVTETWMRERKRQGNSTSKSSYALSTVDTERLSLPFEETFGLKMIDVDDSSWIKLVDPRIAGQDRKRKREQDQELQERPIKIPRVEAPPLVPSPNEAFFSNLVPASIPDKHDN